VRSGKVIQQLTSAVPMEQVEVEGCLLNMLRRLGIINDSVDLISSKIDPLAEITNGIIQRITEVQGQDRHLKPRSEKAQTGSESCVSRHATSFLSASRFEYRLSMCGVLQCFKSGNGFSALSECTKKAMWDLYKQMCKYLLECLHNRATNRQTNQTCYATQLLTVEIFENWNGYAGHSGTHTTISEDFESIVKLLSEWVDFSTRLAVYSSYGSEEFHRDGNQPTATAACLLSDCAKHQRKRVLIQTLQFALAQTGERNEEEPLLVSALINASSFGLASPGASITPCLETKIIPVGTEAIPSVFRQRVMVDTNMMFGTVAGGSTDPLPTGSQTPVKNPKKMWRVMAEGEISNQLNELHRFTGSRQREIFASTSQAQTGVNIVVNETDSQNVVDIAPNVEDIFLIEEDPTNTVRRDRQNAIAEIFDNLRQNPILIANGQISNFNSPFCVRGILLFSAWQQYFPKATLFHKNGQRIIGREADALELFTDCRIRLRESSEASEAIHVWEKLRNAIKEWLLRLGGVIRAEDGLSAYKCIKNTKGMPTPSNYSVEVTYLPQLTDYFTDCAIFRTKKLQKKLKNIVTHFRHLDPKLKGIPGYMKTYATVQRTVIVTAQADGTCMGEIQKSQCTTDYIWKVISDGMEDAQSRIATVLLLSKSFKVNHFYGEIEKSIENNLAPVGQWCILNRDNQVTVTDHILKRLGNSNSLRLFVKCAYMYTLCNIQQDKTPRLEMKEFKEGFQRIVSKYKQNERSFEDVDDFENGTSCKPDNKFDEVNEFTDLLRVMDIDSTVVTQETNKWGRYEKAKAEAATICSNKSAFSDERWIARCRVIGEKRTPNFVRLRAFENFVQDAGQEPIDTNQENLSMWRWNSKPSSLVSLVFRALYHLLKHNKFFGYGPGSVRLIEFLKVCVPLVLNIYRSYSDDIDRFATWIGWRPDVLVIVIVCARVFPFLKENYGGRWNISSVRICIDFLSRLSGSCNSFSSFFLCTLAVGATSSTFSQWMPGAPDSIYPHLNLPYLALFGQPVYRLKPEQSLDFVQELWMPNLFYTIATLGLLSTFLQMTGVKSIKALSIYGQTRPIKFLKTLQELNLLDFQLRKQSCSRILLAYGKCIISCLIISLAFHGQRHFLGPGKEIEGAVKVLEQSLQSMNLCQSVYMCDGPAELLNGNLTVEEVYQGLLTQPPSARWPVDYLSNTHELTGPVALMLNANVFENLPLTDMWLDDLKIEQTSDLPNIVATVGTIATLAILKDVTRAQVRGLMGHGLLAQNRLLVAGALAAIGQTINGGAHAINHVRHVLDPSTQWAGATKEERLTGVMRSNKLQQHLMVTVIGTKTDTWNFNNYGKNMMVCVAVAQQFGFNVDVYMVMFWLLTNFKNASGEIDADKITDVFRHDSRAMNLLVSVVVLVLAEMKNCSGMVKSANFKVFENFNSIDEKRLEETQPRTNNYCPYTGPNGENQSERTAQLHPFRYSVSSSMCPRLFSPEKYTDYKDVEYRDIYSMHALWLIARIEKGGCEDTNERKNDSDAETKIIEEIFRDSESEHWKFWGYEPSDSTTSCVKMGPGTEKQIKDVQVMNDNKLEPCKTWKSFPTGIQNRGEQMIKYMAAHEICLTCCQKWEHHVYSAGNEIFMNQEGLFDPKVQQNINFEEKIFKPWSEIEAGDDVIKSCILKLLKQQKKVTFWNSHVKNDCQSSVKFLASHRLPCPSDIFEFLTRVDEIHGEFGHKVVERSMESNQHAGREKGEGIFGKMLLDKCIYLRNRNRKEDKKIESQLKLFFADVLKETNKYRILGFVERGTENPEKWKGTFCYDKKDSASVPKYSLSAACPPIYGDAFLEAIMLGENDAGIVILKICEDA
tara:strand:- start:2427 stop:7967 length:5541 start_codon:yes stop_codon:yes gene_type:complete